MKKVMKVRTSRHKRNTLRPGLHVATLEPYAVTSNNPQNRMASFFASISSPSIEF
ncbi:hypothetical protein Godav_025451 [Gossypium davidsonii]|uniref:Uncharacterized protein n=2 Tax=Gossypium TaxID=3633 RepID=A0A7J8TIP1_GOSDV|nr:hypothetical protein [Gossypium davidsonii]MBA0667808.1 hypothetical protein [Gossypium klotzschianum]